MSNIVQVNMRPQALQLVMLLVGFTFKASAQAEIYVQPLHTAGAFATAVRLGASNSTSGLIAVASVEKSIKLYNLQTLTEQGTVTALESPTTAISLPHDGGVLVSGLASGGIALWNVRAQSKGKEISAHSAGVLAIAGLQTGFAVSASVDRTINLLDLSSASVVSSVTRRQEDIAALAVHPSDASIIIGTAGGWVRTLSIPHFVEGKGFDTKTRITALALTPNGAVIAVAGLDGSVRLWNPEAAAVQATIVEQKGPITALSFDPKGRWLAVASADSTFEIFDVRTGVRVKSLSDNDGYVTVASFVGEDLLWAGTSTGKLKTWRVLEAPPDTDPPILTIMNPRPDQEGVKAFGETYEVRGTASDKSAIKEISVDGAVRGAEVRDAAGSDVVAGMNTKEFRATVKLDSIGINTFEVRALDAFGNVGKEGIRIQRLSSDQVVEVLSPENNFETEKSSIDLRFKAWCEVASYKVIVNLVEMADHPGIREMPEGGVFAEEIPLVIGYNQVQIALINASGQSFSKTLGVNRKVYGAVTAAPGAKLTPKDRGPGPQRWAVVVGISEYASKGVPALKYADSDAQAFAEFLQRPEGGGFEPDHMRILLNKDATVANLKEALIDFLSHAIDKDLVMIFFAGHGAPDPARPLNLYLLTYDADPSHLGTTAFPMWDIQTVLARHISAKKIVVFSDACHSGGISADFAARGMNVTESNLINQYLADLARTKEGIVVFTASAAGEVSQEFPELSHGAFTYFLLEGMKGQADLNNDYTVTINELMQYVEEQVKRKTKGAQNPTRSQTAYDKDLTISLIAH